MKFPFSDSKSFINLIKWCTRISIIIHIQICIQIFKFQLFWFTTVPVKWWFIFQLFKLIFNTPNNTKEPAFWQVHNGARHVGTIPTCADMCLWKRTTATGRFSITLCIYFLSYNYICICIIYIHIYIHHIYICMMYIFIYVYMYICTCTCSLCSVVFSNPLELWTCSFMRI